MRLNLGCGTDIRVGYTNVDSRQTHSSVRVVDLSSLPWPFEDSSAEEILMWDFLEHFPYRMTGRILMECHRVLSSEGELSIQVPDGELLGRVLSSTDGFKCNRCGHWMKNEDQCQGCQQSLEDIREAAVMRLYGGQDYPGNFHQVCFTRESLVRKASECGLVFLREEEYDHQFANWNFKQVFTRGALW